MIFTEEDVDFEKIDDKEFEELCFDLLLKFGYQSLIWRQGGADSGRDIEANYAVVNPLIGSYIERWFIECKKYSGGVPNTVIESK
jgi:hypothetical protein